MSTEPATQLRFDDASMKSAANDTKLTDKKPISKNFNSQSIQYKSTYEMHGCPVGTECALQATLVVCPITTQRVQHTNTSTRKRTIKDTDIMKADVIFMDNTGIVFEQAKGITHTI